MPPVYSAVMLTILSVSGVMFSVASNPSADAVNVTVCVRAASPNSSFSPNGVPVAVYAAASVYPPAASSALEPSE